MKPREFRLHFSPSQIAEGGMICAVEVKSRKLKITPFEIIDVIEIRAYQALEARHKKLLKVLNNQIKRGYPTGSEWSAIENEIKKAERGE